MLANKLHINMTKCAYMHFSPKTTKKFQHDDTEYTLTLHNTPMSKVTQTKFLGVIIDDKLTWEPHINYLNKKLACSAGTLNRIKDNSPKHLHKVLYHRGHPYRTSAKFSDFLTPSPSRLQVSEFCDPPPPWTSASR